MVNDGGLRGVLQTSDLVSSGLYSLCRSGEHPDSAADASSSAGVKTNPPRTLSEVPDNTDRSIRMDLAKHASSELKPIVAPLLKELEKLDAAALLSLNPSKDGGGAILDPSRGLTVPPIHHRVTPAYEDDGNNIVRYLHVSEVPHRYSVGIFVFPPNAEIPLHDHPDMVVLSRVLYGELQVQSYDVLSDIDDKTDPKDHEKNCNDAPIGTSPSRPQSALRSSLRKLKQFVSRLSYTDEDLRAGDSVLRVKPNLNPMGVRPPPPGDKKGPSVITAPNVTCLFPHEGNCHAFVAGPEGAAVLDVLLPPYDEDDDRDCTFYKANDEEGNCGPTRATRDAQDAHPSSLMLMAMDQPEDFHCLGGSYGRFGTCKEYGGDGDPEDQKDTSMCNML